MIGWIFTKRLIAPLLALATATATVAGCTSAAPNPRPGPVTPSVVTSASVPDALSTSAPALPPAPSGTTYITESDNGHTFTATAGSEILLVLYSSYWKPPTASPAGVLTPLPPPTAPSVPLPTPTCATNRVPGSGCGLYVFAFRASSPGRVTLSSTRSSCGEAKLCPPSDRGFSVTLQVTGY